MCPCVICEKRNDDFKTPLPNIPILRLSNTKLLLKVDNISIHTQQKLMVGNILF